VSSRRRDAASATAALLGLLGVALALDVPAGALLDPVPAALGVAGALALELPFYLVPERADRCWDRPGVRAGAAVGVVVAGGGFAVLFGPRTMALLLAGLLTYFVLLALTVAGILPSADEAGGREAVDGADGAGGTTGTGTGTETEAEAEVAGAGDDARRSDRPPSRREE
jgi:hypothetical protein